MFYHPLGALIEVLMQCELLKVVKPSFRYLNQVRFHKEGNDGYRKLVLEVHAEGHAHSLGDGRVLVHVQETIHSITCELAFTY